MAGALATPHDYTHMLQEEHSTNSWQGSRGNHVTIPRRSCTPAGL